MLQSRQDRRSFYEPVKEQTDHLLLKEYLEDYASEGTKEIGEKLIKEELKKITNPVVKEKATEYIENIHSGQRDFRF